MTSVSISNKFLPVVGHLTKEAMSGKSRVVIDAKSHRDACVNLLTPNQEVSLITTGLSNGFVPELSDGYLAKQDLEKILTKIDNAATKINSDSVDLTGGTQNAMLSIYWALMEVGKLMLHVMVSLSNDQIKVSQIQFDVLKQNVQLMMDFAASAYQKSIDAANQEFVAAMVGACTAAMAFVVSAAQYGNTIGLHGQDSKFDQLTKQLNHSFDENEAISKFKLDDYTAVLNNTKLKNSVNEIQFESKLNENEIKGLKHSLSDAVYQEKFDPRIVNQNLESQFKALENKNFLTKNERGAYIIKANAVGDTAKPNQYDETFNFTKDNGEKLSIKFDDKSKFQYLHKAGDEWYYKEYFDSGDIKEYKINVNASEIKNFHEITQSDYYLSEHQKGLVKWIDSGDFSSEIEPPGADSNTNKNKVLNFYQKLANRKALLILRDTLKPTRDSVDVLSKSGELKERFEKRLRINDALNNLVYMLAQVLQQSPISKLIEANAQKTQASAQQYSNWLNVLNTLASGLEEAQRNNAANLDQSISSLLQMLRQLLQQASELRVELTRGIRA